MEYRCDKLVEDHVFEVNELKDRLSAAESERAPHNKQETNAALQRVSEMAEKHTKEAREWAESLDASKLENRKLRDQIQDLSQSLAEFKTMHGKAIQKYERALTNKQALLAELDKLKQGDSYDIEKAIGSAMEKHQGALVQAVVDLRQEFASVHERLRQDVDMDYFARLRDDLGNIQESLNDAVAELTLETDAMLQSRDAIRL